MRLVVVLAVLALAACQTPCPAASAPVNASYECEDGSSLQVTMTAERATVVQEGYTTIELPVRVAGAGFRYAANGAELRGRLNTAQWTRPGAAETTCNVTQ